MMCIYMTYVISICMAGLYKYIYIYTYIYIDKYIYIYEKTNIHIYTIYIYTILSSHCKSSLPYVQWLMQWSSLWIIEWLRVNLKVKPVTTYYHSMQKSFVCIISDGYLNKHYVPITITINLSNYEMKDIK